MTDTPPDVDRLAAIIAEHMTCIPGSEPVSGERSLAQRIIDSDLWREIKAEVWAEGCLVGMDVGIGAGEKVLRLREDWPPAPVNPYDREAVTRDARP